VLSWTDGVGGAAKQAIAAAMPRACVTDSYRHEVINRVLKASKAVVPCQNKIILKNFRLFQCFILF